MKLSLSDIEAAKAQTKYSDDDHFHEHPDCIRIAYEWLDAQTKTKHPTTKTFTLKHIIQRWAGRYVSSSDVEVAAHMHPDIIGTYPRYNFSARLVWPSKSRLADISEAYTQDEKETNARLYSVDEETGGKPNLPSS